MEKTLPKWKILFGDHSTKLTTNFNWTPLFRKVLSIHMKFKEVQDHLPHFKKGTALLRHACSSTLKLTREHCNKVFASWGFSISINSSWGDWLKDAKNLRWPAVSHNVGELVPDNGFAVLMLFYAPLTVLLPGSSAVFLLVSALNEACWNMDAFQPSRILVAIQ